MDRREAFKANAAAAIRKATSPAELARALGASQMTVSNWQHHGVEQVDGRNEKLLRKLADYLGYAKVDGLFQAPAAPTAAPQDGPEPQKPAASPLQKALQVIDQLSKEARALKAGRPVPGGIGELREQVARVRRLCDLAGGFDELEAAIDWLAGEPGGP